MFYLICLLNYILSIICAYLGLHFMTKDYQFVSIVFCSIGFLFSGVYWSVLSINSKKQYNKNMIFGYLIPIVCILSILFISIFLDKIDKMDELCFALMLLSIFHIPIYIVSLLIYNFVKYINRTYVILMLVPLVLSFIIMYFNIDGFSIIYSGSAIVGGWFVYYIYLAEKIKYKYKNSTVLSILFIILNIFVYIFDESLFDINTVIIYNSLLVVCWMIVSKIKSIQYTKV